MFLKNSFSRKKSPSLHKIMIKLSDELLYEGNYHELPILEEVIISKSIQFFDDATPCFIHRSAVRVRLLAEIEVELLSEEGNSPLLSSYTGFSSDCSITLL